MKKTTKLLSIIAAFFVTLSIGTQINARIEGYEANVMRASAENVQMVDVTFSYCDAFGRTRKTTKQVLVGTDVESYVAENLEIPYRYGYTLVGWSEETVTQAGTISAIYEKLKANGADYFYDFSSAVNEWEINNATTSHSGGSCTIKNGYFRMEKPTAFSRFASRQMYSEFSLEFDVVELKNIQMADAHNCIFNVECGLQDESFSAVNSAIGVNLYLTTDRDVPGKGDMLAFSKYGRNIGYGDTKNHLIDFDNWVTTEGVTGLGTPCSIITDTGLNSSYYVSFKVVVKEKEDGTGKVQEIYTKLSTEEEFSSTPDKIVDLGDIDTTGYVSLSGYSPTGDTDIIFGFDNIKLTNLAKRDSELRAVIPNEQDSQGRYVHNTKDGNIPMEIYLQNQALLYALITVDGQTMLANNGFLKESYDEIIENVTIDAKALGRLYLEYKNKAVNGVLEIGVAFLTANDHYEFVLAISASDTVTVTFYDANGNKLDVVTDALGKVVNFPSIDIGDKKFLGWENEDGVVVNEETLELAADESYVAKFAKQYTVTFLDENGNVLKTQTVNEEESALAPNIEKEGYRVSWTGDNYLYVTKDTTTKLTWVALVETNEGCASSLGMPTMLIGTLLVSLGLFIKKRDK